MCASANLSTLHDWIAGLLVMVLREITDQRDADEVQHDGVDNFMRSKSCFQDPGYCPPNATGQNGSQKAKRYEQPCRALGQGNANPGCGKRCHIELTFSANVEQSTTKSNQHRKPGEDQGRRIKERVTDAVGPGESAADEKLVG